MELSGENTTWRVYSPCPNVVRRERLATVSAEMGGSRGVGVGLGFKVGVEVGVGLAVAEGRGKAVEIGEAGGGLAGL